MPLHADAEPVSLQLDRFGHLVGRPRHGEEAGADPVDPLVMGGGHLRGAAEHPAQLACLADLDVVNGELDRVRLVALAAEPVGEVLDQRAATGHVEDLQAAADGEEGQVGLDGGADHQELEPVPTVVGCVGLLVRGLVVQRGIDVPPPGDDQAVELRDQAGHGTGGDGRQDDRRSARALDGSRVTHRRDDRFANPMAPASSLKLAGDTDYRAAHPSSSLPLKFHCP
jgi:hypothetical protein